jgi:hypothetical protein
LFGVLIADNDSEPHTHGTPKPALECGERVLLSTSKDPVQTAWAVTSQAAPGMITPPGSEDATKLDLARIAGTRPGRRALSRP